jgi:two-component system NtrC family sensor kinase
MKPDTKLIEPNRAGILASVDGGSLADKKTSFTTDELLHLARIVTMGELSACFAHEVSNPLTLIKGHLRFVKERLSPDDPLRGDFEVIEHSAQRIEVLAKHMLDFGKKKAPRITSCEITDIVSEALRFVQPYLKQNFIDVQLDIAPELPFIAVNRWRMIQALVNVLTNAADAMEEVDTRIVSITASLHERRVRIVITDTGVGIPAGVTARIFDPFFTTKGDRGTGLGLYITKQVIEEHRGSIDLQTSDRGTSFVISLPL